MGASTAVGVASREAMRTWTGTFEDWRMEVEEILDAGDCVYLVTREVGRGSGVPIEQTSHQVVTLRNGKIIHWQGFSSRDEALEAAGLSASGMSQENLEIVRRGIDAYNRGDLEGVLDDLAPEFGMHPSGRFADTEPVYRGHQGWIDFWNTFQTAWENITISIERIEDLDDRVLTLGTFHGRGRGSGVEVDAESAWLHTIKDGLVVDLRTFATWKEALEATGLREPG
jgi:ketosteroid isomerase-like protein